MKEEPNSLDLEQEAKEIIMKELEDKGVINYMRAKIKKSIIEIISSKNETIQQKFDFDYMTPLHRLNKSKEIILVCQLIKEFLKFYELEYTLPIFENESNVKENIKRETLLKELKLEDKKDNSKPVLLMLLQDKLNRKEDLFNNQNKKNIDRYELSSKSERDSINSENKKLELNPTTFGSTNKSLEMAEPMTVDKFNNLNINEVYKNENDAKKEGNNLNENKFQSNINTNEIKDIKFEEAKNNEVENLKVNIGAKNNNEILKEKINENIIGKEIKEKEDNKLLDNQDSQSGQAFESTTSNQ